MSPTSGAKAASFSWSNWQENILPPLADHSAKKLDLLREYVVLYLQIVCQNVGGKESQPINIVDGFAGGGRYQDKLFGSPIVLLQAVKEAEALINLERQKPLAITPTFYFIEKDRAAHDCLLETLKEAGYGAELGKSIKVYRGEFSAHAQTVVQDIIARHPRGGGRTIFFLDQCGYVQVSPKLIGQIHAQLSRKSEFIINFAIDWLSDFLTHTAGYQQILTHLDINEHVSLRELLDLKERLPDWRYTVEAKIGEGLRKATGLPYFSPFYIEPEDNHRGYWLLHLAPVSRARAAMITIHWRKANRSKHYGPRGLGILSYKPEFDQSLYLTGMTFDDSTRKECARLLAEDVAQVIFAEFGDGITAGELEKYCCNRTIADNEMLEEAIWALVDQHSLKVASPSGQEKRARTLAPDDLISPNRQLRLFS
ncbi:MAG TPA: three-Cys-motif partner protein TcmP [Opitutaceae bacterium]